jgi:hypothetical protein
MFAARPLFRVVCLALPLALGISGCETMEKLNPFAEKQTPLPGERRPLFPEGVPGVEFNAPPPQPSNSNIPIAPAAVETQQQEPAQVEQQPLSQARAPQPTQPSSAQSKSKTGNSGDAWDGTR